MTNSHVEAVNQNNLKHNNFISKILKITFALSFISIMSACTSVQYLEYTELPIASEEEALVYFFRESKFVGGGVSYYIYEGDEQSPVRLGGLKNGTFFYIYRHPGNHTFWAKTEAKDSVTLELAAGEIYYIKGEVDMGILAGRPDLTIVHPAEGRSEIPELRLTALPDK